MKNKHKIPTIFFAHDCEKKFQEIKMKLKNFNGGHHKLFHIGAGFNLFELVNFRPDIVIQDYDRGEIFVLQQDIFKQINPF